MGRVAKKAPETPKVVDDSPIQTITQTRARRTPKPNPKYANESVVATPKLELSESNGSTDIEDKLPESKIVKSTKKVITSESAAKLATAKTPAGKGKPGAIKKQKIEFDDDEKTKDADEIPLPSPTPRTTRSGKGGNEKEIEIKVGDESVAIVDVSSIITKEEIREDSPKVTRGSAGRKRQADAVPVIEIKDDSPKKKKEEEKTSLITARKSYMPTSPVSKQKLPVIAAKPEPKELKNEPVTEAKKEVMDPSKNLVNAIKTRRSVIAPQTPEIPDKKPKVEVKVTPSPKAMPEPRKLPVITRKEPVTKIITPNTGLANKTAILTSEVAVKPAPRLLNSMVTPKGAKESPIVKLAGDGTDRKVFSIEMSDGSVVEKKPIMVTSPVKSSPIAVKENIGINKPQPSMLLKNKLESELSRMKASATLMKRQSAPFARHLTSQVSPSPIVNAINSAGARRITKFESWYVIDVKDQEHKQPLKHTHTFSLIQLGNNIKEVELPTAKWEYKITLQKRVKKTASDDEIYTGEVPDRNAESDKHNYEPNCILFKRCHKDNSRVSIDRSVMFKPDSYAITMNGKTCHLLGAPSDIKSLDDIEILLNIVDSSTLNHSSVESNCGSM